MAVTANIKGTSFNEGGGVTFTSNTGTFDKGQLVSGGINQNTMALPADSAKFHNDALTLSISVGATTATLVAATPNRSVEVLSYTIVTDSATTVTWQSNGNSLSGGMTLAANGGISSNIGDTTLFTNAGEALKLTNSAGNVNGHLTYRIV
mgnify:CR=1 FL=1